MIDPDQHDGRVLATDDGVGLTLPRRSLRRSPSFRSRRPGAIHFSPSLAGQTIQLTQIGDGQAPTTAIAALAVPAGKTITIDASNVHGHHHWTRYLGVIKRIFCVGTNAHLNLTNVVRTGGYAAGTEAQAKGGAIYSDGTVNLQACNVISNRSLGFLPGAQNGVAPEPALQGGESTARRSSTRTSPTFANNYGDRRRRATSRTANREDQVSAGPSPSGRAEVLLIRLYDRQSQQRPGGAIARNSVVCRRRAQQAGERPARLLLDLHHHHRQHRHSGRRAMPERSYDNLQRHDLPRSGGANLVSPALPGATLLPQLIPTTANPLLGPLADHGNGMPTFSLLPDRSPAAKARSTGGAIPGSSMARWTSAPSSTRPTSSRT